jgi:hypothetical protein
VGPVWTDYLPLIGAAVAGIITFILVRYDDRRGARFPMAAGWCLGALILSAILVARPQAPDATIDKLFPSDPGREGEPLHEFAKYLGAFFAALAWTLIPALLAKFLGRRKRRQQTTS